MRHELSRTFLNQVTHGGQKCTKVTNDIALSHDAFKIEGQTYSTSYSPKLILIAVWWYFWLLWEVASLYMLIPGFTTPS